ncbi:peptidoglycan-binding domain-containing protein [Aliisedimentitalea scapharcae]|uniref:Peptidoglycan-binding domain-containing protein n=1 Tax=Aliisedimentitalea scapharcae TaxID=1524259 RepID=A0ABZ2XYT3_9RHOB
MINWISAISLSISCTHLPPDHLVTPRPSVHSFCQSGWFQPTDTAKSNNLVPAMSKAQNQTTQAKRQERDLKLEENTRAGIEQTLAGLGLRVGTVDGQFDQDTRNAIRAFQEDSMFPVTGYIDDVTFGRLLAIGIIH